MSITYSEFLFVVLVIQHSMRMGNIVMCGIFGPVIFLHLILKMAQRERNSLNMKIVLIFPTTFFLKPFSF